MTNPTDRADGVVGRFWLAHDDEHAIPGRLTLAEGANPRLELAQPLSPGWKEVDLGNQAEGFCTFVEAEEGPGIESLVVHGALDGGTLVTLVDAFTKKRTVGGGRERQWLEAHRALLGGHATGPDDHYSRIRLRLRHLDGWATLPGFSLETSDAPHARATLEFQGSDSNSVALAGGGRLDLEQEPEIEFSALRGGRIGRVVWLRIVDLPPMTAADLDRRFGTPLSSLLTLATGTGCPLVAVEVASGPDQPWLMLHHSGLRAPAEEERAAYRQLLPLALLGLDRVAAWLDAVEELGPLPPVVAAAVARRGSTLETQLLELTTIAEGLHRRLFKESRRLSPEQARVAREAVGAAVGGLDQRVREVVEGEMKHLETPSFPQRLMELADSVVAAMPGVTGQTNRWKQHVTALRNKFAHRDYDFLQTKEIAETVTIVGSLRWLLTGLLLLQTGLSPAELAARVEAHEPYRLFRQEARKSFPRVCDAGGGDC
jgi:hypothetical protein